MHRVWRVMVVLASPAVASAQGASEDAGLLSSSVFTYRADSEVRRAIVQVDEGEDVPFFATVHSGAYGRISGLVVQQLNDLHRLDADESFEFNTGGGVTLAGGYRDFRLPLAFEIEYAYRGVSASDDDTRLDLHTFGANMLFDASDLVGPFGVYAGAGIGVRIDQVHIRSTSGTSRVAINGSGFFWQAMGGVTVSVAREAQLYGGVRFTDAGTLQNDEFRVDTQALNYEFGFRFFF